MLARTTSGKGKARSVSAEPPELETVSVAIARFQPIRNRFLKSALNALAWLVLLGAFVSLFPGNYLQEDRPQLFGTGLLTVSLSLFAFQTLLAWLPDTLAALWRRRLIPISSPLTTAQTPDIEATDTPNLAEQKFVAYIRKFKALLNQRQAQWILALAFVLLTSVWLGFLDLDVLRWIFAGDVPLLIWAELAVDFALAALLGPLAWRLLVIGWQIWRLPLEFDLRVQFEHPDHCGGLEPVGNLCLWNILIISLPLIYLGSWLLIARTDPSSFSIQDVELWRSWQTQVDDFEEPLSKLLWVLIPFTLLGFVLPLWTTHRLMTKKRRLLLAELDDYIHEVSTDWDGTVKRIASLTKKEGDEKLERLEFAQKIYDRQKRLPVWPVNTNLFLKFASTQAIPWLSITGLGPGLIKVIALLLDLLTSSVS